MELQDLLNVAEQSLDVVLGEGVVVVMKLLRLLKNILMMKRTRGNMEERGQGEEDEGNGGGERRAEWKGEWR